MNKHRLPARLSRLTLYFLETLALGLIAIAAPASAEGPEQLYEPGPAAGRLNIEYNGRIGASSDAERAYGLEAFYGISDRVSLGVELETEVEDGKLGVEELGLGLVFNLTDELAPVELALLVQAGVTSDGDFPQLEARFIAERMSERWHAVGNVIVRRVDAEERGASVAYALLVERRVADDIHLGTEVSGQLARLGGFGGAFERGTYFGPSLSAGWDISGERELELGVKYLRRLDGGDRDRHTVRLVASLKL